MGLTYGENFIILTSTAFVLLIHSDGRVIAYSALGINHAEITVLVINGENSSPSLVRTGRRRPAMVPLGLRRSDVNFVMSD